MGEGDEDQQVFPLLRAGVTGFTVCTLERKHEFRDRIDSLSAGSWPGFMLHGNVSRWHLLFDTFPQYQIMLVDPAGELIAAGHTVPLNWDGTLSDLPSTIDGILSRADEAARNGKPPDILSALAAMVSEGHRGCGLSGILVEEMRALAYRLSCTGLIAPVRPTLKSRYPLAPFERYVDWERADGSAFDPWIRVHRRLGAVPLCVAPNTLTVEGTVGEWEEWTGIEFPETGPYIVPGALQPVSIDRELDLGRYEDPNLWMLHSLEP